METDTSEFSHHVFSSFFEKKKKESSQGEKKNVILKISQAGEKSYEPAARSHGHAMTQPSPVAHMR